MGRDKDFYVHTMDATVANAATLKIGGTASASTAAELDQYVLNAEDQDVSTASSLWVVAPFAGTIISMHTTIAGAIATAPWVATAEIAGTAVTGISCSISHSGSAAGDAASSTATALNTVTAGQVIEIVSAGASVNTIVGTVTLVMQRS